MNRPMKPVVVASVVIVLAIASPILSAQKQPNSPAAGNAVTAEGKILWQYNTHG